MLLVCINSQQPIWGRPQSGQTALAPMTAAKPLKNLIAAVWVAAVCTAKADLNEHHRDRARRLPQPIEDFLTRLDKALHAVGAWSRSMPENPYREVGMIDHCGASSFAVPITCANLLESGLQKFASPIPKASFDRIEPVYPKSAARTGRFSETLNVACLEAATLEQRPPVRVLLTGGGAALPFVRDLASVPPPNFVSVIEEDPTPPWVAATNWNVSFKQLAVAVGGAMPSLPEQK
jgi:hypothetical protein